MNKAIIFGITGQDGSHLADLLSSKNYKVIGVTRRSSTDTLSRVRHLVDENKIQIVEGDITDIYSVMSILRTNADVDEVYNLAAQSHVATSFSQPALTWRTTGEGCINILQSIVDLGIFNTRFYQASSSEMFGSSFDIDSLGNKYQDENTKFLPQSPYAIAKCAAHYAVRLYREAYNLHASAGILFNHEGPRRGDNFVTKKITNWVGDFKKWLETHSLSFRDLNFDSDYIYGRVLGNNIPKLRLGNLDSYRDWGYAGDYVEAMWLMLQQEQPDDYVICTGKTYKIRDFLDIAFNHIGIENWNDLVVVDKQFYRPAEVDYLMGSYKKAYQKLGWSPKHDLNDLVSLMLDLKVNEKL